MGRDPVREAHMVEGPKYGEGPTTRSTLYGNIHGRDPLRENEYGEDHFGSTHGKRKGRCTCMGRDPYGEGPYGEGPYGKGHMGPYIGRPLTLWRPYVGRDTTWEGPT